MKTCLIIGAAEIKNYSKLKECLDSEYFVVYCDGGLHHKEALGFEPNLVVGDFDSYKGSVPSVQKSVEGVEVIKLPCEKDDTDVFFAIKESLQRGFKDFVLVGVIGQRFDHSLCNISVLLYLQEHGASAVLYDDYSKMQLVVAGAKPTLISDTYSFFSLMCIAGDASGVIIRNAKYPLEDAKITTSYQFGISNEVLPNKKAEVGLKKGVLLLIQVW